jgi:hypothetical protein
MNKYYFRFILLSLVLFAYPAVSIADKPPAVSNIKGFISPLNQNTLEQRAKDFFLARGFTYRKDKEIRKGLLRRISFERNGVVLDVVLLAMKSKGTLVTFDRYSASEDVFDVKDTAAFLKRPSFKLPDYSAERKAQVIPYHPLGDKDLGYPELDIPEPEQSELLNENPPDELVGAGGMGRMYKSMKNPKEIAGFYRSSLKRLGFIEKQSMMIKMMHFERLRFESNDRALELYLSPRGVEGTFFIVVKYRDKNGFSKVESNPLASVVLPKKDSLGGVDISDIPRPKGSIRWSGQSQGGENQISYIIPVSILEARNFYRREMLSLGWRLNKEVKVRKVNDDYAKSHKGAGIISSVPLGAKIDLGEIIKDSYILDFKSASASANIMIYPNFINPALGSIAEISYTSAKSQGGD